MKRQRFFLCFFVQSFRRKMICAIILVSVIVYITNDCYKKSGCTASGGVTILEENTADREEDNKKYQAEEQTEEQALSQALYAGHAVLMDGDTGEVLFGKDEDTAAAMASTTKIMTCIIALECADLPGKSVISAYASSQPRVHLGVPAGTQFRTEDLLYSMMLESHNDSAAAVAENAGAAMINRINTNKQKADENLPEMSVTADTAREASQQYIQKFLDEMNRKAADIGCTDTYFMTPNGLDKEEDGQFHHSTAADMARILRYCIYESPAREKFLSITRTQEYVFSSLDGSRSFECYNHNQLLQIYDTAVSGKTGFTNQAGYCYVGAVESEGRRFIVSLLACGWPGNRGYKWEDAKNLISYGEKNYERMNLADLKMYEGVIRVNSARTEEDDSRGLVSVKSEGCEGWFLKRKDAQIQVVIELPETVDAPVKKGQIVGNVLYYADGKKLTMVKLTACDDIKQADLLWFMCIIIKKTAL